MARLMALDLGEKRIGIAVSDPEQRLAFPDRVLTRRSAKADRQTLAHLRAQQTCARDRAAAECRGAQFVGRLLIHDKRAVLQHELP